MTKNGTIVITCLLSLFLEFAHAWFLADRGDPNCPCFVQGTMGIMCSTAPVDVKIYEVPEANKLRDGEQGFSPIDNGILLVNRTERSNRVGCWNEIVFITREVNLPGRYVLYVSGTENATRIGEYLVLNAKRPICPLRLAGSPPRINPENGMTGTHRIVGGPTVSSQEFTSYNVFVKTGSDPCTGSVIANDWILTSISCSVQSGDLVYVGGSEKENGTAHRVRRVDHNEPITVAQLTEPIRNARPIALNNNTRGPTPGTIVRATGYGGLAERIDSVQGSLIDSKHLRMVDNMVLSTTECKRRLFSMQQIDLARSVNALQHVCVGQDKDCKAGGVCDGDQGGPVVARSKDGNLVQIGISSFDYEYCLNKTRPDVYYRVSTFVPWIQRVVSNREVRYVSWVSINNTGDVSMAGIERYSRAMNLGVAFGTPIAVLILIGILLVTVIFFRKRKSQGQA